MALLAVPPTAGASTEALSVDLATNAGPMTGVGEGFLYVLSQDGSAPGDGYRPGTGYQARITSVIDQAEHVTRAPYHAEYVLMLSDL